jgi:hypothetical protein
VRECRGRLRRTAGSHIAGRRHHYVDSKAFQLGPVDGRENLHRCLRCARRPVEWKRKAGGPGADLHDAAASFPKRGQECVHDRQGAEYVDFELVPHGVERQNFQRPGSKNACVVDEEIKAAAQRVGYLCRPGSHNLVLRDVADRQADAPAGGLLQILDLGGGEGCTENDVTLVGEPEGDVAAKTASSAGNHGGFARIL